MGTVHESVADILIKDLADRFFMCEIVVILFF
jgi:hypothetical protein